MPTKPVIEDDEALIAKWSRIEQLRSDVQKALEIARANKIIGASLEAKVTVYADGDDFKLLDAEKDELCKVFIVSEVETKEGNDGEYKGEFVSVDVVHAHGDKCERCWVYSETVGSDPDHPTLCKRCADIMK